MDGQPDDGTGDRAEAEGRGNGVPEHQLGFYQGENKKLVIRGIFMMRMFLLNMNGYPEKDELADWAEKAYDAACQLAYGINYKGMIQLLCRETRRSLKLARSNARVHRRN